MSLTVSNSISNVAPTVEAPLSASGTGASASAESRAKDVITSDAAHATGIAQDPFLESLDGILNDSSLSVEDKITALLMKLMEKMDGDIQTQLDHVRTLQENGSQSSSSGSSSSSSSSPSASTAQGAASASTTPGDSIDTATFQLQRLAARRNELFDTLNAIVDRYQQSAQGVIRTLSNN